MNEQIKVTEGEGVKVRGKGERDDARRETTKTTSRTLRIPTRRLPL